MTASSNQAVLDLQVLGVFTVRRNGQPLELPQSRKTRALLAYLAVSEEPQRRERLCELLWDTPDDLRAALRWSLSKIRKVVNVDEQELLDADRHLVTLKSQAIALDLRQVRALSLRLPSAEIAELEQAARALKSGFLEDLSLPRCRQYESWRLALASEVDVLRAGVLRALVDRLAGEPSRALPYALALQAMDPANSSLVAQAKAVANSARHVAAAAPAIDGKRQDVTILSIEIVSPLHGFVSVAPEVVFRQLDPLFDSAQQLIAEHGGLITASGNVGIVALFDSAACENHALAACRAALAIKSTVEKESEASVRVRAGLDSGEVIVRHRRHGTGERIEVTGVPVRTAGRLVHSLRRGLLAITDRTQLVAAGLVAASLLPRSDLSRFGRDGEVYQLLGEASQSGDQPSA